MAYPQESIPIRNVMLRGGPLDGQMIPVAEHNRPADTVQIRREGGNPATYALPRVEHGVWVMDHVPDESQR